jgi:hypothetical protein
VRYYDVIITDPATGKQLQEWSSLTAQGNVNPSALNVEFDITENDYTSPQSVSFRLWGIPITFIRDAAQFNKKSITVYGGMSKGLPLANPAQQGIIVQGLIYQAFGNWQGTDMTLDFVIVPLLQSQAVGSQQLESANIVVNWKKGQQLSSALTQTLQVAFPGVAVDMQISPNLVLGYNEQAVFQNLSALASFCDASSQNIINQSSYLGVKIVSQKGKFVVRDGTTQSVAKPIAFNDLIGQITLGDPGQVIITTVLRGDLAAYDWISIPPGQVISSSSSYAAYRQGNLFTGVFQIASLRHVGNFRQKNAESWVTVVTAIGPQQKTVST